MNSQDSSCDISGWFCTPKAQQEIRKPQGNCTLARGAFGEVSLAIHTGQDRWRFVAVKSIGLKTANKWGLQPSSQEGPKLPRVVFNEICALRLLNPHPNIVELKAVYPLTESSIGLAFAYCPIDLYTTLEWRRRSLMPPLPLEVAQGISHDLFSALHHCHSNGCLHLDIKPGNLLVTAAGHVQLCDFGLAQPSKRSDDNKESLGEPTGLCTLYYRPPELLFGSQEATTAVDMYSAGLVCCELLAGFPVIRGKQKLSLGRMRFAGARIVLTFIAYYFLRRG